jgi:hypothetical protein
MLSPPTPYPQQGSFALFDEEGKTHAVRIHQHDQQGFATISFPGRIGAASGNKRVPIEQLLDGTPLDEEERAELKALERFVHSEGTRPSQSRAARIRRKRYQALRLRDIRSATLANLIALFPKVAA